MVQQMNSLGSVLDIKSNKTVKQTMSQHFISKILMELGDPSPFQVNCPIHISQLK